jgi:hypothetical protein
MDDGTNMQHRCHICTGTGLTPAHIWTGTGLTLPTSAPGLSYRCSHGYLTWLQSGGGSESGSAGGAGGALVEPKLGAGASATGAWYECEGAEAGAAAAGGAARTPAAASRVVTVGSANGSSSKPSEAAEEEAEGSAGGCKRHGGWK